MSILKDGKLAKTIANALGNVVYPLQLKRTVAGPYVPGVGPTTTTTFIDCTGFADTYSAAEVVAGIVQSADKRVTILANSLATAPAPATDKLVLDGVERTIVSVRQDAAGATWELQVR